MTTGLKVRPAIHASLANGGWLWADEILNGHSVVGVVVTQRTTRRAPVQQRYTLLGRPAGRAIKATEDQEFGTLAEFMAAYEQANFHRGVPSRDTQGESTDE